MKNIIDVYTRSDKAPEYKIPSLSPERQERIVELTMKKVNQNVQPKKTVRVSRIAIIAAATAALLCGTVFAYTTNLFGFADIFGTKHSVVSEDVVTFGEDSCIEITQPVYSEEERKMIEEGKLVVPVLGDLSDGLIGATTEGYGFTLEEMLTTPDTLLAVVRVDALTEAAKASLHKDMYYPVFLQAINNTEDGRNKELINGGLDLDVISRGDGTMQLLVKNSGGEFLEGDKILFHHQTESSNVDLFEVPVIHLLEEKITLHLNPADYADQDYQWDTLIVTPISVVMNGRYTVASNREFPVIVMTLQDGSSFELANERNNFFLTPLGSYGSMSFGSAADDGQVQKSWILSQVVDLSEIVCITVDGTEYLMNK